MTAVRGTKRSLGLALATTTAVWLFAAPALAEQYAPRRAEIFSPPAVVALTGLELAPLRAPQGDPDFTFAEAVPAAVLLDAEVRPTPGETDPLDLAWSLLAEENRALALAVGSWAGERGVTLERRRLRAALARAYAARSFAPFWIENGEWRASAAPALARLAAAGDDGLD
ncbi:L,D-transpeptidase, partial [Methylocystis sp. 9N]